MTDRIALVEAAWRMGVGYTTAHRLVLCGDLPATRRGKRWFVSREAVERLVAERETESQPLPAA